MKSKRILRCLATDGEMVKEGEFNTIKEAWERASDMGSRWFFYPIYVITGKKKILDACGFFKQFVGQNINTLQKFCEANQPLVCDIINQ